MLGDPLARHVALQREERVVIREAAPVSVHEAHVEEEEVEWVREERKRARAQFRVTPRDEAGNDERLEVAECAQHEHEVAQRLHRGHGRAQRRVHEVHRHEYVAYDLHDMEEHECAEPRVARDAACLVVDELRDTDEQTAGCVCVPTESALLPDRRSTVALLARARAAAARRQQPRRRVCPHPAAELGCDALVIGNGIAADPRVLAVRHCRVRLENAHPAIATPQANDAVAEEGG
mmetsp:Transcript_3606/g.9357  ORF Transcript_3606/g.9357 Transcript_3606/m.9357 type:complete len:235 (+) Transcript_3606:571-1275(+)